MGVPAFFRWLSRKYPSIIVHCVEEKGKIIDGVTIPVDSSQPNPNEIEVDNLYLDMNGIIHPCCHPEDKPAPKNEDEMMVLIFEYIDRIFSIVRPRRLLYMAIDGVAPRAKMNQQRSRRFRAAKESKEKREEIARIKEEMRSKGLIVPPDKPASEHFDSNCITPGTPFMFRLADCLRYYIHDRLNTDPGWKNIHVILSDANMPGEGEHKIMDYIRKQRGQPDHDPNTHHCLCGADADLIMLGLATHEPNFTIIREEFKPNQPRPCEICAQLGHETKECTGLAKDQEEENKPIGAETEFIFIRLSVLREYLSKELEMTNLPFKQDIERAIDDWVFMCFFVGNDFLPHLPSLEIRENAIDRLVNLYKKAVYKTGGYITDSGLVNLERVHLVLADLGEVEDEIFKKRRDTELGFRKRNKARRRRERQWKNAPKFTPGGQFAPVAIGSSPSPVNNPRQAAFQGRQHARSYSSSPSNMSNKEAAGALKAMFSNGEKTPTPGSSHSSPGSGQKRKHGEMEDSDSEPEPADEVKLWEDGWKDRYYTSKFGVDTDDIAFRHLVGDEYVKGLCWVLRYYYQGCASWKWYFPYHYAPFASDFVNVSNLKIEFEKDTKPFKPLEQLMSVFPAASKAHLPPSWQLLMYEPDSPIIDFYPIDFRIDLNGKKYAWQGVALLPFVEEARLKEALIEVYPDLSPEERARNVKGGDRLFVGGKHLVHDLLEGLYENEIKEEEPADLDPSLTNGIRGKIWCDKYAVMNNGTFKSPLSCLEDLELNQAIMVQYSDPQYDADYIHPAKLLPGAIIPEKTLKPEDFEQKNPGQRFRPQLGFGGPNRGYPPPNSYDSGTAKRHIRHTLGRQDHHRHNQSNPGMSGAPPLMGPPNGHGRQEKRGMRHWQSAPAGLSRGGRGDRQQRGGNNRRGGQSNYGQQGGWNSSNQRQSSNDRRDYGGRSQGGGYQQGGSHRQDYGGRQDRQSYGNQGYGNQRHGGNQGYGGGNQGYSQQGYGGNQGYGSQGYGNQGGYRGGQGAYGGQQIDSYSTSGGNQSNRSGGYGQQRNSNNQRNYPAAPRRY